MAIASYRDLEVYQRSMTALVTVHKLAVVFPDYERYGLADQIRRASKSLPANIAEGYGRRGSAREFKRYLNIALGSANEMIVHLEIAEALGYAEKEACLNLIEIYNIIGKMLYRLGDNWRSAPPNPGRARSKPSE